MKICVISGSPAGENSITLQTVLYLQKCFPGHEWETLHAGSVIKKYERDFTEAAAALNRAEMLLFCYPVYTFLAPSQLQRFIELMKEAEQAGQLHICGKAAAQITTSKHFYDVTALRYIRENCGDLKLQYLGGLSEDMEDLLSEKGRKEAEQFFRYVLWQKTGSPEAAGEIPATVIVADLSRNPLRPQDADRLQEMIDCFRKNYGGSTKVVDLAKMKIAGGCLGCFHCASDGVCIYQDSFDSFLRKEIQTAPAVVYAFSVRDHSMGALFKMYDDRQFCNGHRTVTMGKPTGYLVSGSMEKEENLRMVLTARADVGGNFLAGIAEDEDGIRRLASVLSYALQNHLEQPHTFYGVGGLKIFRDLIYQMRGLMKADHRFYKEHGFYDFPQKHKGRILLMYLVGAMNASPKLKKKMGSRMTEGIIMPYRKVLEKAGGKEE